MELLTILPGIGVGPIRLGMSREEFLFWFKEPWDSSGWDDGNLDDFMLYRGLRVEFSKYTEYGSLSEERLYSIEVLPRPDVRLFGRRLEEWQWSELFNYLESVGYTPRCLNGDIEVRNPNMVMSFDETGLLYSFDMWGA
jgi:hypothetical protein